MFLHKSIVIARQLEELRAESAARRLVRVPASDDAPRPPKARRRWWTDDPAVVLPQLVNYPYPAR
jgi:hypothetical protein